MADGQALPQRLASLSASFEIAHPRWCGRLSVWSNGEYHPACGQFHGAPHFKEFTISAGSRRRALLRWVQIALKPASKALGLHGVFKRGKGRKYLIADSAFKRMQVDAPGPCWVDANEHHLGLALRTGGALNCSEWNDGRQALRLGHDASLEQAGAQHSLSPVMPRRRSGDCLSMRLRDLKRELNSRARWFTCLGSRAAKKPGAGRNRPTGFSPLKRIDRGASSSAIRQHLLERCLNRVRRNPKFNEATHLRQ